MCRDELVWVEGGFWVWLKRSGQRLGMMNGKDWRSGRAFRWAFGVEVLEGSCIGTAVQMHHCAPAWRAPALATIIRRDWSALGWLTRRWAGCCPRSSSRLIELLSSSKAPETTLDHAALHRCWDDYPGLLGSSQQGWSSLCSDP